MTKYRSKAIATWFEGLHDGDLNAVVELFDPEGHTIRNAANPAVSGPTAAAAVLTEFLERTSSRSFEVHSITHGPNRSFAWWTGQLTFADGATVAGRLVNAFTATVTGVDVFTFNDRYLITEAHIVHETTSIAIAAAANARPGGVR